MSFVAKSTPSSLRAPGPWEHRDISANGAQFHLVEAGPEDGQTLLLLHGFPEFWWTWRKHIPYLAELGYRVVAMDLRGFGASDKQPGGYSVVAIAHDVAAVIGCLGVEQVVVIGHGVGGAAAWITPSICPQVSAMVAVAAPHPQGMRALRGRMLSGAAGQYLLMQLPWLPEYGLAKGNLVRSLFKGWAGANPAPLMAEVEVYKEALGQPYAARRALDHLRQYRSFGKKERLLFHQKLRVPVLTIQGEIDPVMPAQAFARDNHHVAGLLRQVSVPGAGHFPQEENPAGFQAALRPFLDRFASPTVTM